MRRTYISPEFDYKPVYGSLTMEETSVFFGSKMIKIEDSVDILNENGVQFDSNNSNIIWQESFNLNSIIGINNKKVKISNSSMNNNGLYDIQNFSIINNLR